MQSNQLVTISTHGEPASAGLDFRRLVPTRPTDADGLSGCRDHGPLVARLCTRARWKKKQSGEEAKGQHLWKENTNYCSIGNVQLKKARYSQYGGTNISSTPERDQSSSTKQSDNIKHWGRYCQESTGHLLQSSTTLSTNTPTSDWDFDTCWEEATFSSTMTRSPWTSVRKNSCLVCTSRRPQSSKEQCAHTRGGNWRTCWRSGTGSLPRRSKNNMCTSQTTSSSPGNRTPTRQIFSCLHTLVSMSHVTLTQDECSHHVIHSSCAVFFLILFDSAFCTLHSLFHLPFHSPDLQLHLACGSVRRDFPCTLPGMRIRHFDRQQSSHKLWVQRPRQLPHLRDHWNLHPRVQQRQPVL